MSLRRTVVTLACAAAITALLLILGFLHSPWKTLLARRLMDFGHAPLFGLITVAAFGLWRGLLGAAPPRKEWSYALALTTGVSLGVISELLQIGGERDADPWDFARDCAGAGCALLLLAVVDRRLLDRLPWRRAAARGLALAAAAGLLVVSLLPVAVALEAYRRRDARFPTLNRFDSSWESYFIKTTDATFGLTAPPKEWTGLERKRVGRLRFHRTGYSTLKLQESYPDWRSYDTLALDLFSEAEEGAFIALRVDDQVHNEHYTDRFAVKIVLHPGINRVRIPLADVRAGPRDREMDMSAIRSVMVYTVNVERPFTIYLTDLRLERAGLPGSRRIEP